ncbi:MAG TPA: cytochrome c biogenesis protein [Prosthecochloris aestuarii]|uniref:Cytochrome c biogenesis protein n=1 Tax=Prosthecochloris aestuarii TaxID=1102 RepID=A0A831SUB0_PROAE|nr:cytochrome c biogenesis protein [Prosthecochloris aestuarii]
MKQNEVNDGAWSFSESIVFSVVLVMLGFAVELVTGAGGVSVPSWPFNLLLLVIVVIAVSTVGIVWRRNRYVEWLGGIPLGLSLIFALAFLSFFGGILPQEPGTGSWWVRNLRLNQVFSSWPFALTMLLFLFNLGLSLVWKIIPYRSSNLQFILFHGGFWMAMSCGLLGTADLQRVIIPLYEGQSTSNGYNSARKEMVELPFSLHLEDFSMEEYAPQLGWYDPVSEQLIADESGAVTDVSEGREFSWPDLTVRVAQYLPHAVVGQAGVPVPGETGKGGAYVRLEGSYRGSELSGWVSTGSPSEQPAFILTGDRLLVLMPGTARSYRSEVRVLTGKTGSEDTVLEVNRPHQVNGWKLYQMGYDEAAGKWSKLSLVEGVRDPWLPAVYTGFFMILAGNLLFFWKGMKKTRVL